MREGNVFTPVCSQVEGAVPHGLWSQVPSLVSGPRPFLGVPFLSLVLPKVLSYVLPGGGGLPLPWLAGGGGVYSNLGQGYPSPTEGRAVYLLRSHRRTSLYLRRIEWNRILVYGASVRSDTWLSFITTMSYNVSQQNDKLTTQDTLTGVDGVRICFNPFRNRQSNKEGKSDDEQITWRI